LRFSITSQTHFLHLHNPWQHNSKSVHGDSYDSEKLRKSIFERHRSAARAKLFV
jgi:hypothetical protein